MKANLIDAKKAKKLVADYPKLRIEQHLMNISDSIHNAALYGELRTTIMVSNEELSEFVTEIAPLLKSKGYEVTYGTLPTGSIPVNISWD